MNSLTMKQSTYLGWLMKLPLQDFRELTLKIQSLSSQIYDLCNCHGMRIDYILK